MSFGTVTALGILGTISYIAATHFAGVMADYDRNDHVALAHALSAAQSTVIANHDAEGGVIGGLAGWTIASDGDSIAAEARAFADTLAPPGVFQWDMAEHVVVGSDSGNRTFVLDGYQHPGGSMIGFVWQDFDVTIHLFGEFDESDLAGVAQHLPKALRIERAATGTPAHDLAGSPTSLAIVVPHPSSRAGMGEASPLIEDDDAMYDAPVVFDAARVPAKDNEACGGANQIAADAQGRIMVCTDIAGDGRRVWRSIEGATIDGDFYCVKAGMPAHPNFKAPNMIVKFADWEHDDGDRDVVVPAFVSVTDQPTPKTECPAGFEKTAANDYFCQPVST